MTNDVLFGKSGYGYAKRVMEHLDLEARLHAAMRKAGFSPAGLKMSIFAKGDRCYLEQIVVEHDDFATAKRAGEWLLKAITAAEVRKYVEHADVAQPPMPVPLENNLLICRPKKKCRYHVVPQHVAVELFVRFSGD